MERIKFTKDIFDNDGVLLISKGKEIDLTQERKNVFNAMGIMEQITQSSEKQQSKSTDIEKNRFDGILNQSTSDLYQKIPSLDSSIYQTSVDIVETIVFRCKDTKWYYYLKSLMNCNDWLYPHCINVALISCIVGVDIGFKDKRLFDFVLGAALHDIGMTLIPQKILNKPSKLTDTEMSIARNHSNLGYLMLEDTELSELSKTIILQHHEKNDGTGYPNGLKSKNILDESKIVAIAEYYDTATTQRPYKQAIPTNLVINDINSQSDIYENRFVQILSKYV